jgi:RES domain-containing protein
VRDPLLPVAELTKLGTRHVVGVEDLLPRVLYRYGLELDRVLNLTDDQVREHIGITVANLTGDDWGLCQAIGTEAHAAGDQAIRTYSATGVDTVLVVFPELTGSGLVTVELVERWEGLDDL